MADRPRAILTPSERERLHDVDAEGRDELRVALRERLYHALLDLRVLALTLRDADIDAAFCQDDDDGRHEVRAAGQHALALLLFGLDRSGDDIEYRVSEALRYAGFWQNRRYTPTVDIVREPLPAPEHQLQRIETQGAETLTIGELEHLIAAEVDSDRLTAACDGCDLLEPEDLDHSFPPGIERTPQTVITSVETTSTDTRTAANDDNRQ